MRTTKSMIVNIMALVAVFFVASCMSNDEQSLRDEALKAVPVAYEPLDESSVVVYYDDGTTEYPVQHSWTLMAEDTIKVQGVEAFKPTEPTEPLSKKAQDELMFVYNYGKVNTLKVTGIAMTYKGKTIYPKNMSEMLVKGSREVVETAAKPFYELSATNYTLVYGSIVLASARQMFVVDEGYVPAFERATVIDRDKHNIGTVEAKLANNKINIICLDSLLYAELFDDNTLRNEGRLPFHSFNECSLSISGTEVNDTTAVVGKSWTGGTASFGGFELSTSWLSNKVSEKTLVATMSNGTKVDFIDSLHVCKWVPVGGKVLSTKKIRLDYAREGQPADKTSVEIDVNITQRVSLSGYERVGNPIHDSWNATYETSDGFAITCNNHVVVREVMSDGSKGSSFDLPYKSTNVWTVSGKTSFQVESLSSVLNVREDIVNGSANIAGNLINLTHSMSAEKVSKGTFSYQPAPCEAVAKYITVISATQALVDIYHDNTKIGEYIIPVNITENEAEKLPGKIVAGWATDSYESSTNFHYNWHSSTFHIVVLKDGAYTVYSRDVNATSGWRTTSISSTLATNGMPLAYVGDNGEAEIGYIEKSVSQGTWYKIVYNKANNSLDKALSATEKAFHKDDDMFQRNPVRGTWSNGKISADGHTLYVIGSED